MTRVRSTNIGGSAIADIVGLLDGWSGKLTWELLIDAIEKRMRLRYTRQALHQHERIQLAFAVRKKILAGKVDELRADAGSPELQMALDQIERLKGENRRLEIENRRLLEQFARWAYNAHTRALSIEFLNTPLPDVNREQSDRPRRKKSIERA